MNRTSKVIAFGLAGLIGAAQAGVIEAVEEQHTHSDTPLPQRTEQVVRVAFSTTTNNASVGWDFAVIDALMLKPAPGSATIVLHAEHS
jgi:hypothetical protein